ncbi:MAG: hypothetical protein HY232_18750 [Acidobacteria bacterium]|nr:hypothetical protein [Acidobacteriota bacterium]
MGVLPSHRGFANAQTGHHKSVPSECLIPPGNNRYKQPALRKVWINVGVVSLQELSALIYCTPWL